MKFGGLLHVAIALLLPTLCVAAPLAPCAQCPGCVPVQNVSGLCAAPVALSVGWPGDEQGEPFTSEHQLRL